MMKNHWLATALTAATAASAQNSAFLQCIEAALSNETDTYSLPQDPLFLQGGVTSYNLAYNIVPAAITFPKSQQQVSDVVKCAHSAGVAVQARSGGHSYANYGRAESKKIGRGREVANNGLQGSEGSTAPWWWT